MHIQISLPRWCSAVQSFESISLSVVCALYHSIRLSASLSMQAAFRHTNQDVFLWRDHSTVGCFCCKFCTTENTAPDPHPYFPACILRMFSRCLRTQVFMRPRPHCRVWFFHWEGMATLIDREDLEVHTQDAGGYKLPAVPCDLG